MTKTLAAILALAALTTAAQAQVTMQPDGGVSCPGAYYAQRLDGRLVIVCPPPPVSPEASKQFGREWQERQDANDARWEADRKGRRCQEIPRPSFCN